jgi:hypothetical protein
LRQVKNEELQQQAQRWVTDNSDSGDSDDDDSWHVGCCMPYDPKVIEIECECYTSSDELHASDELWCGEEEILHFWASFFFFWWSSISTLCLVCLFLRALLLVAEFSMLNRDVNSMTAMDVSTLVRVG